MFVKKSVALCASAISFSFACDSGYRQFCLSDSTSRVRYSSGYTCQYERGRQPKGSGRGTAAPIPVPQVFSLLAPSFLTHTLTPLGCWLNSNNHLNIVYLVNAGTLNATRPHISTYISGQWRFFEESMLEQLHRYTHEIINSLSVWEMLSAVLAIHFIILF